MPDQLPEAAKRFAEHLEEKLKTKPMIGVLHDFEKTKLDILVIGLGLPELSTGFYNDGTIPAYRNERTTEQFMKERIDALEERLEKIENFLVIN